MTSDLFPGIMFGCGDGYRITRIDSSPLHVSLHVERVVNAETVASEEVFRLVAPGDFAYGAVDQMELVLASLCRYFNTGGEWDRLENTVERFRRMVKEPVLFGPHSAPYYRLVSSGQNRRGDYEHVFTAPYVEPGTAPYVLWVERRFVALKTRDAIERERIADEERQNERALRRIEKSRIKERRSARRVAAAETDFPALPCGPDPAAP